jgi:TPR repeat protein
MSGKIFISYRRDDSSPWAGRLSDRLSNQFPSNEIFMDVDSVDLGEDFVNTIEKTVGSCDVLIAVIGKGWLTSRDQEGKRRLENSEDYVRTEIATALRRGIRVIPVLVEGASMPQAGDLPDDLKALSRRNALQLSHDRFRGDSERLVSAVGRALEKTAAARHEREENGRLEHAPQTQAPTPVSPSPSPAQLEADEPSAETPKVHPLPPKPAESEHEEPPPPSSGGTGGKTPSKQLVAFLAVVAALVVAGLIYLAEEYAPRRVGAVSPLASSTPQPTISSPTPSAAGSLAQAQSYLDAKDYAKALPLLQKAADAGDTNAMNSLGWLYANGKGVTQDYGKAREWYQKAAAAGNTNAMNESGWLYQNGYGVAQDYGKAREWYQKAADAGNTEAMYNLGLLYTKGLAGARDYGKAHEWFQKAADAGNTRAMNELGGLYEKGYGLAQDYGEARKWFQKAADAGNTNAMNNLGLLYENGNEVAQDYGKAREWFQKAADAGNTTGMYHLGSLYEKGNGVAQDYGKAREWFQKAADAGNTTAKEALEHLRGK